MQQNRLRKRFRTAAWVIFPVLGILLAVNFFAAEYYRPIIEQKLKEQVQISTHGLYHITFKRVKINFLLGRIRIKEASLDPDDSIYRNLAAQHRGPLNLYHIKVKEIFISLNQLHRAVLEGLIHVEELRFTEPKLFILNSKPDYTALKAGPARPALPPILKKNTYSKLIKKVEIETLNILHGTILYQKNEKNPIHSYIFKGDQVELESTHISLRPQDFEHISLASILEDLDYKLSIRDISFLQSPGLYTYSINKLMISSAVNEILAGRLEVKPQFRLDGPDSAAVKREYFTLSVDQVMFKNKDVFKALKTGSFNIPKLSVEGADLIYHASGRPSYPVSKTLLGAKPGIKLPVHRHPMPQEFLKNLQASINLDSIEFNNSNITYQEEDPFSCRKGLISFNESKGLILHLSNDSASLHDKPEMSIYIQTNLYHKGHLNAEFHFDMQSKQDSFWYAGKLGYFNVTLANAIIQPLASLKIARGVVRNLQFQACGDSSAAKGQITMYYNTLSLKMLELDTSSRIQKQIRLISSLANTFVVLNDNPLRNSPVRTEEISANRNPDRSFLNFFWASLLSGIKPSVGFTRTREVMLSSSLHKFHQFGQWRHQGKSARIEKRQQRRKLRQLIRESD